MRTTGYTGNNKILPPSDYVKHLSDVHSRHNHMLFVVVLVVVVAASVALLVVSNNQAAEPVEVNVIHPAATDVPVGTAAPVVPAPPAAPTDSGKPWYRVMSFVFLGIVGAVGLLIAGVIIYNKGLAVWYRSKYGSSRQLGDATKEFSWTAKAALSLRMVRPFLSIAFLCLIGSMFNAMNTPVVGDMLISIAGIILFIRLLPMIIGAATRAAVDSVKDATTEAIDTAKQTVMSVMPAPFTRTQELVRRQLASSGFDRSDVVEKMGEITASLNTAFDAARDSARQYLAEYAAGVPEAAQHLADAVREHGNGVLTQLHEMSESIPGIRSAATSVLDNAIKHAKDYASYGSDWIRTAFSYETQAAAAEGESANEEEEEE